MRRKIVIGNWKMNKTINTAEKLITDIRDNITPDILSKVDVVISPPFTSLQQANILLKDSKIFLGAQNLFYKDEGAFTGEISASMLRAINCDFVIIGHSERRIYFCDTNSMINQKIKKAIENDIKPVVCVGEALEERERNMQYDTVDRQITEALKGISKIDITKIIIAYEPVWAIGTGKNATPEVANEMHQYIRNQIKNMYSQEISDSIKILYGGSVNEINCSDLFCMPNIDGGLIGGACLKADTFLNIIKSAALN